MDKNTVEMYLSLRHHQHRLHIKKVLAFKHWDKRRKPLKRWAEDLFPGFY